MPGADLFQTNNLCLFFSQIPVNAQNIKLAESMPGPDLLKTNTFILFV